MEATVMKITVNLDNVKYGKTKNHLLFEGSVPSIDNFYTYKFDFTGTDLTSTASLNEKQLNVLKKKLNKNFGYAPFDESKAKSILGNGKQYQFKA